MATYAECLAALPAFQNDLLRDRTFGQPGIAAALSFSPRGAFSAFATPLANVHATGVGIRCKHGEYVQGEHVIKVFVFDKVEGEVPGIPSTYGADAQIPIDIEHLPIQTIRAVRKEKSGGAKKRPKRKVNSGGAQAAIVGAAAAPLAAPQALPAQRARIRPIVGGVSISPLNANFVGTLGCFLLRPNVDTEEIFVLSNNHVLADVDRLPPGTPIVQPGPEVPPFLTATQDAFATLHTTIPIQFPANSAQPVFNRFDAAIANITNGQIVQRGSMFGMISAGQPNPDNVPMYDPGRVVNPEPDMRVMKMGRTTGFTRGRITATNVQGVEVNYGTQQFPRIAVFRGLTVIVGDGGNPFSLPGDSGSVILEEATGHPVALLFAGDGVKTMACDLGALCQQLGAWPV
jgi:hypothetical protein